LFGYFVRMKVVGVLCVFVRHFTSRPLPAVL
jgi:hypothetical protein